MKNMALNSIIYGEGIYEDGEEATADFYPRKMYWEESYFWEIRLGINFQGMGALNLMKMALPTGD